MNSSHQNNNGGIFNEDQGYFRNNNTKHIANRPTLNLAALSNCSCNDKTPDVIISLNTIFLNWLSSLKSILSTRIYHYYKIIKLIIRYYFKYKFTINGQ